MHGRMRVQCGDGAFGTCQGVMRGLGRQHELVLYNVIGFWCCGVAFGWWLTFKVRAGQGRAAQLAATCVSAVEGAFGSEPATASELGTSKGPNTPHNS